MNIDPDTLDRRERYALMISTVIPRPIGWISTIDGAGAANLAPYSFFNAVTSEPPTLMISVGRRKGARKDTANNLLETKEAVVHIPHRRLAEQMVATSAEVTSEVDEFELAELERIPSDLVRPFRIKAAAIAMECRMVHHQEVGRGPVDLFLLEVIRFHLDDAFVENGRVVPSKLCAVGRLGGASYADTSSTFDIRRPAEAGSPFLAKPGAGRPM